MRRFLLLGIVFLTFHIGQSNPEFCQLSPDEGEGPKFNTYFHYDPVKEQCSPFIYKGEKGNPNRFDNERECIRNCSDRVEEIYPVDASKACTFKKQVGGCNNNLVRYYYDAAHDKCKKFQWTGCLGNGNRFLDYASCNATCNGIHEDSDDPDDDGSDTPIAIICGVLIGLVILAIIITVTVLMVRSNQKKSNKSKGKSRDGQTATPLQTREIEMA